jgi:hypothetical protein
MGSITIDSEAILKTCEWIAVILVIVFAIWYVGTDIYNTGRADGVASAPTVSPTPAPTPTPQAPVYVVPNTNSPVYVVSNAQNPIYVTPTPKTDYISDVQSTGTDWGYVCMVDQYGKEYLIMNFDQNTAELFGASYSGTEVGTYNGIPELENVALTVFPQYYYNNQPDEYHSTRNYYGHTVKTRYGMAPWGIGV